MQDATGTGRTVTGSIDRAALGLGYEPLLLHCPTGHLSAAVAGIACGHLETGRPPEADSLCRFFSRVLQRRGPGAVAAVLPRSGDGAGTGGGGGILCLARGQASALVETALSEVARVAGVGLLVQPALRAAGARPGRGQSPIAPRPARDARLFVSSSLAGFLDLVSLPGLADRVMAAQVRRLYSEIAARAHDLPGPSLRRAAPGGERSPAVRIIYHCFGAAHTSVTAAALHCGRLPARGRVTAGEVLGVPGFDRRGGRDIGAAFFFGCDSRACEVYVIGFDGSRQLIARAAKELLAHVPGAAGRVLLAETLPAASALVKVGGYSSRRLGLVRLGRPLAAMGILLSLPALRRTVDCTRQEAARMLAQAAGRDDGRGRVAGAAAHEA